jgi:hypothetical protein
MDLDDLAREDPVSAFRLWHVLRHWHRGPVEKRPEHLRLASRRGDPRRVIDVLMDRGCPRTAIEAAGGYNLNSAKEGKLRAVVETLAGHWPPPHLACWEAVANIDPGNVDQMLELAGVRSTDPGGSDLLPLGRARDAAQALGVTADCLEAIGAGVDAIQSVTRQLAEGRDVVRLLEHEIQALYELPRSAHVVPDPKAPGIPLVWLLPLDAPIDHERGEVPEPAELPAAWGYPPVPMSPGQPFLWLLAVAADSVEAVGRGWYRARAGHCPNCGVWWLKTVGRGRRTPRCPGCRAKDLRAQSRAINWDGDKPFIYWDNHLVYLDPHNPVRLSGHCEIEASASGFRTYDIPPVALIEVDRTPRKSR